MESTLKDLKERRSIRAYKPEQIKEEELRGRNLRAYRDGDAVSEDHCSAG